MRQLEPTWISIPLALSIHAKQISAHGGAPGLRDPGRLEAALNRPRHRYAYEQSDFFVLAASYAHGIASGHPFIDGNKRVSLVVCMTFLDLNSLSIKAGDDETYDVWIGLAQATISEAELAVWLRACSIAAGVKNVSI